MLLHYLAQKLEVKICGNGKTFLKQVKVTGKERG